MARFVLVLTDSPDGNGKISMTTDPPDAGQLLFDRANKPGGIDTLSPAEHIAMSLVTYVWDHSREGEAHRTPRGPRIVT